MPEGPEIIIPDKRIVPGNPVIPEQVPAVLPEGPQVPKPVTFIVPDQTFIEQVPPLRIGRHGRRHSTHRMRVLSERQTRELVLPALILVVSLAAPAVWVLAKIATTPLKNYLPP